MKALVYTEDRTLQYRDVPEPRITRPDEVLLRIRATGICGTDIHILGGEYSARPGIVLGHESTAVIEAVGAAVTHVKVGDEVALDPAYRCGVCHYCLTDRSNYCIEKPTTETGVSCDGTFAPLHVARANVVHRLPEGVSFTVGTLTEPLGCVLNAFKQTRISVASRVLVVGAGPIGLIAALTAQHMGCEVTVGELDPYRLDLAGRLCREVQDYRQSPLQAANERRRYDIIVDTSGCVLDQLLPLVDAGGDILLMGLDYRHQIRLHPSFLTDHGIRLIGSIDSNGTIVPALQLLARHADYADVITQELPLGEYAAAFKLLGFNLDDTSERGAIQANKIVLTPSE